MDFFIFRRIFDPSMRIQKMGRIMTTSDFTQELHFITTTVVDWIDVFTRPDYKRIVVDSLSFCQLNKGLDIYAWVLMTNHLHMIAGTKESASSMGDVIRDFCKFTSKSVVKAISENPRESRREWMLDRFRFRGANDSKISQFRFWQEGYYSETISSRQFYRQKLEYIHMNPVRQGIVDRPENYLYSSARDYSGERGLIDVIVLP